jgi:TPP-dependent 2-oxoacid decarboxylase
MAADTPAIQLGYNDIANWRYSELPKALGCDDWYTAKVTRGNNKVTGVLAIYRNSKSGSRQ